MIRPLRKRHLQVWALFAVLLPAGIFTAWLSIPNATSSITLQPGIHDELPLIINSVDKEAYTLNLRSNNDRSVWQLQWINKKVLTFPAATIYKTDGRNYSVSQSELVGRIESKGNYVFALGDSIPGHSHFMVYDFIHDKEIERIDIK
jgi:hypothetical protein